MAQPQPFKFGNATILVDNGDFANGYSNGFVRHPEDEDQLITVEEIRRLIVENLSDLSETPTWNTGSILGSIVDMYAGVRRDEEPEAPQIHLGSLTLHLNRWRFRDGYYIGQEKYQTRQAERPDPDIVTARELLNLIAHRDPATHTYYFGAEDLAALEDLLGELVGYLCTALLSQTSKEPSTGPLAMIALQET